MKFKSLLLIFVFIVSLETAWSAKSKKELGNIARIATAITSKQHYRQRGLDDDISSKLFDEYFKMLDPSKIYFTQKDIAQFESYRKELDNNLSSGKIAFACEVYALLLAKVNDYEKFAKECLKKGFDFKKDETFIRDRSDARWPNDDDELRELWRKKIKNDILFYRLMQRSDKEKSEKKLAGKDKNTKKDKAKSLWEKKTPEERVAKRIEQFANHFRKNEDIDILEMYLGALKKIYDPHSTYMSPQTVEDFNIQMKLSLVGIGALLSSEDGYTKIVKLIPGGPAEKDARLKSDDRIIAVAQENEEPVDIIDMPISKVVRLIRGKINTKVFLTILEGAKGVNAVPKVIELTRNKVLLTESEAKGEIKKIKAKDGEEYKVGVISLPSFYLDFDAASRNEKDYKSSTRDVRRILEKFAKDKVDGVILDIRSNGGGSLLEAIKLTGLFIERGPVVQVRAHNGLIGKKYDPDEEIYYKGPLVVLINRFSASASEIFAGAIKDYSRGIVVGDSHSHGKGTVQTIYELDPYMSLFGSSEPAGSLKLTTAKFYRVNGSSTQEKGVEADVVFPAFTDSMEVGEKYLDYVLPWDSIDSEEHIVYDKMLGKRIPDIRNRSMKRIADNDRFKNLKKNIEYYAKRRKIKEVSLNEKKRWDEYIKEKEILESQSKLLKLNKDDDSDKDKKNPKDGERRDLYLEETLNIMSDYIDFKKNKVVKPIQPAQLK